MLNIRFERHHLLFPYAILSQHVPERIIDGQQIRVDESQMENACTNQLVSNKSAHRSTADHSYPFISKTAIGTAPRQ